MAWSSSGDGTNRRKVVLLVVQYCSSSMLCVSVCRVCAEQGDDSTNTEIELVWWAVYMCNSGQEKKP
jgi:hypothetical protein